VKLVSKPPAGSTLLVFYTDPHLADTNPESRVGDYRMDILGKLVAVWQMAQRVNTEVLICGGDLFHRKAPRDTSHYTVYLMAQLWRALKMGSMNHVSLVGNHDVRHGRVEDIEHQPLGMLKALAVLDIMDSRTPKVSMGPKEGKTKLAMMFKNADYESEGDLEAFQFERPDADVVVQVVHTMLMPAKSGGFPGAAWLRWEDFETPADIVLIGHPHTPFAPAVENGRVFVAPGSLGRCDKTLTHIPQVAFVWVAKDECCVQYIPIPTAKPYAEVFKQAGVELEQALGDLQVKSFVEQYLAGAELSARLTPEGLTQAICDMDMPEPVKQKALFYLGRANDG
jgi:predicted phosphodiesterase